MEIFDAQQKQATQALLAKADAHVPTEIGEMEPTPEMVNLLKRIAESDDPEQKAAYQLMYDRAKWTQMSTWSG